ncbi:hypothetical protein [Amycolatopsis sp. Hca4]|uniref:hypothetical protein n=1 Tax=Amycolatopsis sp. Hca4 TaxID=2742131 RepID=UPI0015901DFB|nr:hypothetical protein [Amycolatopsis sp. Hca4]QKV80672.1 hypothetical protein HUT10_48020 [Amycolatopsis sp. Hca4]
MIRTFAIVATVALAATACASGASPDPGQSRPASPTTSAAATPTTTGIDPSAAAHVAPVAPAQLEATAESGTVRLQWPSTGEDVAYYEILRRAAGVVDWTSIGRAAPTDKTYLDKAPSSTRSTYGIRAVNGYGTSSAVVESRPVTPVS